MSPILESTMTAPPTSYNPLLNITRIAMALNGSLAGHTIDYNASVPSTMQIAGEMVLSAETRSGAMVIAEEQTAGLGRLHRAWEAPHGQALLVSLILKQPHLPLNPAYLPMLAGIAVVRAIAHIEPALTDEIGLKWPNDVLLGQDLPTGRKVAGILIEAAFQNGVLQNAVIGMGINVNQDAGHLPAVPPSAPQPVSLRQYLGRTVDRSELLIALGRAWDDLLGERRNEHDVYHEWRALLYTLGQPVTLYRHTQDATPVAGVAVDVTPDGELVILDTAGVTHTVGAGDVTSRQE